MALGLCGIQRREHVHVRENRGGADPEGGGRAVRGGRRGAMRKRVTAAVHGSRASSSSLMMPEGVSWV